MTETTQELPNDLVEFVNAKGVEFRAAIQSGDFATANAIAHSIWDAIPDPKSQWTSYPVSLPRGSADMFVRAGGVEHAVEWLTIARGSDPVEVGKDFVLDRVEARVRLAMGDRETAGLIAGTLLELYGTRAFTGENRDLLALAKEFKATPQSSFESDLPLASGGVDNERADLEDEIERLADAGSQAMDDDNWRGAVGYWAEALTMLPAPRSEWAISTWLYTVIGDAYYIGGELDAAAMSLGEALKCPDSLDSPYLWLRLGQAQVDRGDVDGGTEALLSAYMLAGAEVFEEENPKYLDLLAGRIDTREPVMSTPKLSNAEWAALSESVASEFERLFVDADSFLGMRGVRIARAALKSLSLKSERKVQDLTAVLVLADLAGRGDVLIAGSKALRAVPFTGNMTVYEPIRQSFCGAARRAIVDGGSGEPFVALIDRLPLEDDPVKAAEWREILRSRAEGSLFVPLSESKAAQATSPAVHHVVNTCMAVQELYLMWAFGRGPIWTRDKIDAEIESATAILRRLGGII